MFAPKRRRYNPTPFGLSIAVKKGATNKATALTHEERRDLIAGLDAFCVRRIPPMPHGGVLIVRELPTEGRRVHVHNPWDEETGYFADRSTN